MPRTPDIWPRKRKGKVVSWYVTIAGKRVALRTKDAQLARQRAKLAVAGKWPPPEEAAARASAESFELERPVTVGAPSPAGLSGETPLAPQAVSAPAESEEHQSADPTSPGSVGTDWTAAAAAAGADANPIQPEVVNPAAEAAAADAEAQQLAEMLTAMELWLCKVYAVAKAKHPAFEPPEVHALARAIIVGSNKQILTYGGLMLNLPPWLTQLVIPAGTIIATCGAIARNWYEIAKDQKAGGSAEGSA